MDDDNKTQSNRESGLAPGSDEDDLFTFFLTSSPIPIIIHSGAKILFLNPACLKAINGKHPEDYVGQSIINMIHPDYRQGLQERIQNLMTDGIPVDRIHEKLLFSAMGVRDVEVSGIKITYQGEPSILAMFTDITEQITAQTKLEKSEQRYRAVFENIQDIYFEVAYNGQVVELSPSLERYDTDTRKEIIDALNNLFNSENSMFERLRNILLRDGSVNDFEFELAPKNNDNLWFSLSARLGHDAAGNPAILFGTLRDISPRKHIENALSESEARLNAAVNAIPMDLRMYDLSGRCIMQNKTSVQNWGNHVGKTISSEMANPETFDHWQLSNEKTHSGQIVDEEVEFDTEEQRRVYNYIASPVKSKGNTIGSLHLNIDITRRTQAEEYVHFSDVRFQELYEASLDGFARADLAGKIIECNSTFATMLGYTSKELVGVNYRQFTPPKWHTMESTIMRDQVLVCGHSELYEKEYKTRNGEIIPIEIQLYLNHDHHGTPIDIWVIVRDLSEKKRSQQELESANSALREERLALKKKNAALEELLHQFENERNRIKADLQNNMDQVVHPMLDQLSLHLSEIEKKRVQVIKGCLDNLTSPFISKLKSHYAKLTPREIEVCNLIRNGTGTKEIADSLGLSESTVFTVRKLIRKKLKITNKGENLVMFLSSLEEK